MPLRLFCFILFIVLHNICNLYQSIRLEVKKRSFLLNDKEKQEDISGTELV